MFDIRATAGNPIILAKLVFFFVSFPSDQTALVAQMQSKLVTYRGLREAQSVDLVIRRKKVIKTATDVIRKQTEFSFYKDPVIHFSGEDAVDLGGPKREFFRYVLVF